MSEAARRRRAAGPSVAPTPQSRRCCARSPPWLPTDRPGPCLHRTRPSRADLVDQVLPRLPGASGTVTVPGWRQRLGPAASARRRARRDPDRKRDHRRATDTLLREVMDVADGIERMHKPCRLTRRSRSRLSSHRSTSCSRAHELVAFRPAVGSDVDGHSCEVIATVERPGLRAGHGYGGYQVRLPRW